MVAGSSRSPFDSLDPGDVTVHPRSVRFGLSTWGLTAALFALAAFVLCFTFPANFDYWWHLAAGRTIWETGALPSQDLYSFTASGRAWIEHSWALELIMYALYSPFGMAGPASLYAAAFAGMLALAALTLRGMGLRARAAAPVLLLLLPVFLPYIGTRPQVFGFLLFAALLALVERYRHSPDRRVWVIPFVFVIWANMHGSYAIGLGWLALVLVCERAAARLGWTGDRYLAGGAWKRLAISTGLAALAVASNPAGPELWIYPFTKFGNPWLQYIIEWKPTPLNDPRFWPFVLLAGSVLTLLVLRRTRPALSDLVVTAGLCFAALYGRRFIPFASLWLVVMYGRLIMADGGATLRFGRWFRRAPVGGRSLRNLVLLGVCAALALATARPPDPGAKGRLPVAAVDYLGAAGLSGPLFNDYNWGGYLIWRLTPAVQVFIDGRGDDLYMDGEILPDYFRAVHLLEDPEPILDRHGIRQVLHRPDTPFVRYLRATGRWQTVYDDGDAVLLERTPDQR